MAERIPPVEKKDTVGNIPKALDVDEIDKLRANQTLLESGAVMDAPFDDVVEQNRRLAEARNEGFDGLIEEYLKHRGVKKDTDPDKYDEYSKFLRERSVDVMPKTLWENGDPDDDTSISERAKTLLEVNAKYTSKTTESSPPVPPPVETTPPPEPEEEPAPGDKGEKKSPELEAVLKAIDDLEKELPGVREARHAAFGARMAVNTLRFRKKRKLNREFKEAEELYLEKLRELQLSRYSALQIEKIETTGEVNLSAEEEEAFAKDLEAQMKTTFTQDREAQRKAIVEHGGLKAKLLEKWANMSTKKKVVLGATAGLILAGSGFGLTVLAGAGGGALAAGLGAGLAGLKSVRAWATVESGVYAKHKKKDSEGMGIERKKGERSVDYLFNAVFAMRIKAEKEIKSADRRKNMAAVMGLGAGALGFGAAVHFMDMADSAPKFWGGKIGEGVAGSPDTPEVPPAELEWKVDVAPTPEMSFSPEASQIFAGDGGYDLFNRMDIPQEHWGQLWDKVGPDLANVKMSNGVPFGYQMPNGEWGVHMPPVQGEGVPRGALEMIASKHQELFGTNPGLPNGGAVEVVSAQHPLPPTLDHSPLTASDVDVLQDTLREGGTLDAAAINAHPEVFNKLSYVGKGLDLHTYTTQALGLPDRWAGDVEAFVATQLEDNNRDFSSVFDRVNGEVVFRGSGKIPPEVLARLFNSIPLALRTQFALAG